MYAKTNAACGLGMRPLKTDGLAGSSVRLSNLGKSHLCCV